MTPLRSSAAQPTGFSRRWHQLQHCANIHGKHQGKQLGNVEIVWRRRRGDRSGGLRAGTAEPGRRRRRRWREDQAAPAALDCLVSSISTHTLDCLRLAHQWLIWQGENRNISTVAAGTGTGSRDGRAVIDAPPNARLSACFPAAPRRHLFTHPPSSPSQRPNADGVPPPAGPRGRRAPGRRFCGEHALLGSQGPGEGSESCSPGFN